MQLTPGQHLKGYELRERLAAGGFGAVYRAYQTSVGRDVAIKVILPNVANQPDFIRRFEIEAQLIARLEHLHIVPLYDYWRDPDGAYLVMRWLKGGTLADALQRGAFDLEAALLLTDHITAALEAAHRGGVIHRDLKPANIFLDEDGNAYLGDFGIAKDLTNSNAANTADDAILGTLDYISPEQARSEPITPRTDIYSLGVVLYELLTGSHPFPNVTSVERLYKHLNEPLPLIDDPDLPAGINDVIQKATAKDPAHRFASAAELAAAFRGASAISGMIPSENPVEMLTLREQEILHLIIQGLPNKEIAQRLTVTVGTVKWYITQIYKKLHVRSRVQAIVRARELDLIRTGSQAEDPPTLIGAVALPTSALQVQNPYKGLRAFKSADHEDYFGQEKLIEKLVRRLSETGENSHFLAVIGPSGSGKSSLVKAGLIPALWRGAVAGSERWYVAEMLPADHPLDELEVALTRIASNQAHNLREHLERDRRGLLRAAQIVLPDDGDLLLLIDQFEEAFTLLEDEAARVHFLDLIHTAVTEPRSRVRVVITLRADFYDRPLQYPDFGELVRSRMETILPLSAEGLERAIARPAERVGVSFETGLIPSIIQEIHYQPGALPLLQYALTELFEQRQGRVITHDNYRAIGKTTGALAKRAEEIYLELDAKQQAAAQQMFLRLVTLGEGVEDTRRRTLRSELSAIAANSDEMDEIIDMFSAYRLLSLDHDPATRSPTVEVAHEAILREWERLRGWLNASRHEIRLQRQLATAVTEWHAAKQENSFLLRGARLEQFEKWSNETQIALTPDERAYLTASLAQRQTEHTLELARQERERQLERRSRTFLRSLVILLALAFISVMIFALFALDREAQIQDAYATSQANLTRAEREAEVNHSLVLANAAEDEQETGSTELALMLALEAYRIPDPPAEAERVLRAVADAPGSRAILAALTTQVNAVTISPDSQLMLAAGCASLQGERCTSGEIVLFDGQTAAEIQRFNGHTDTVTSVLFTPDGRGVWSASADGSIALWDITGDARIIRQYDLDLGGVRQIAQNADGTLLLAATESGVIAVIDATAGTILRRLEAHEGSVNAVAFSPDGQQALSGGADAQVILWDVQTGDIVRQIVGHTGSVLALAFHPDGLRAVSCGEDFAARLWDLETGEALQQVNGATLMQSLAIQPDGSNLVVEFGGSLLSKDFDRWSDTGYLMVDPTGGVNTGNYDATALAFAPSGEYLLSGLQNGEVILWTMTADHITYRYSDAATSSGFAAFDLRADGRRMAAGTVDTGEALLWDVDPQSPSNGTIRTRLPGHQGMVFPVVYSPDGTSLLVGSGDWFGGSPAKSFNLWNVDETSPDYGTIVHSFEGLQFYPRAFAFTPDGHYILVGTQNLIGEGELVMWDARTGELVARLQTGQDVSSILVSADVRRALTVSAFITGITEWDIDPDSADFGQAVRVIPTESVAYDLEWGPTPATFFLGDLSTTLQERDYQTGQVIRSFSGSGTAGMWAIDLSTDQQQVITGGDNGEIILWDYPSGREIWRAPRQSSYVPSLFFRPDGRSAVSMTFPGLPIEWSVAQPGMSELLSWIGTHRYQRDFTCAERSQYQIEPLCAENGGTP
ncbi:MAG: protein kinase [Anaerolineae bacterium]|nr:protein kinase [Anaerolineae bacterium]